MQGYPCGGAVTDRFLYIFRNFLQIYRELLWDPAHSIWWVQGQIYCIFIRLICALLLPPAVYRRVSPWLVVASRAVAPACLVAVSWLPSPGQPSPSARTESLTPTALKLIEDPSSPLTTSIPIPIPMRDDQYVAFSLRWYPLMDVAFNLIHPSSVSAELLYALFSLLCVTLLGARPAGLLPPRTFHLGTQLTRCALSTAALLGVELWRRGAQHPRGGGSGRTGGGSGSSGSWAGGSGGPDVGAMYPPQISPATAPSGVSNALASSASLPHHGANEGKGRTAAVFWLAAELRAAAGDAISAAAFKLLALLSRPQALGAPPLRAAAGPPEQVASALTTRMMPQPDAPLHAEAWACTAGSSITSADASAATSAAASATTSAAASATTSAASSGANTDAIESAKQLAFAMAVAGAAGPTKGSESDPSPAGKEARASLDCAALPTNPPSLSEKSLTASATATALRGETLWGNTVRVPTSTCTDSGTADARPAISATAGGGTVVGADASRMFPSGNAPRRAPPQKWGPARVVLVEAYRIGGSGLGAQNGGGGHRAGGSGAAIRPFARVAARGGSGSGSGGAPQAAGPRAAAAAAAAVQGTVQATQIQLRALYLRRQRGGGAAAGGAATLAPEGPPAPWGSGSQQGPLQHAPSAAPGASHGLHHRFPRYCRFGARRMAPGAPTQVQSLAQPPSTARLLGQLQALPPTQSSAAFPRLPVSQLLLQPYTLRRESGPQPSGLPPSHSGASHPTISSSSSRDAISCRQYGVRGGTQLHRPYRGSTVLYCTRIKIEGYEPEHVAPGYRERIAALVARAGMELENVEVRRGCLELLVEARVIGDAAGQRDREAAPAGRPARSPTSVGGTTAAPASPVPAAALSDFDGWRVAGSATGGCSGGAAAEVQAAAEVPPLAPQQPLSYDGVLDIGELIRALQLPDNSLEVDLAPAETDDEDDEYTAGIGGSANGSGVLWYDSTPVARTASSGLAAGLRSPAEWNREVGPYWLDTAAGGSAAAAGNDGGRAARNHHGSRSTRLPPIATSHTVIHQANGWGDDMAWRLVSNTDSLDAALSDGVVAPAAAHSAAAATATATSVPARSTGTQGSSGGGRRQPASSARPVPASYPLLLPFVLDVYPRVVCPDRDAAAAAAAAAMAGQSTGGTAGQSPSPPPQGSSVPAVPALGMVVLWVPSPYGGLRWPPAAESWQPGAAALAADGVDPDPWVTDPATRDGDGGDGRGPAAAVGPHRSVPRAQILLRMQGEEAVVARLRPNAVSPAPVGPATAATSAVAAQTALVGRLTADGYATAATAAANVRTAGSLHSSSSGLSCDLSPDNDTSASEPSLGSAHPTPTDPHFAAAERDAQPAAQAAEGGCTALGSEVLYSLDLESALHQVRQGVVLLEARPELDSRAEAEAAAAALEAHGPSFVPVLVVEDPRVAEELQLAADSWHGTVEDLDNLLYDFGTLLRLQAELQAAAAAATPGLLAVQLPAAVEHPGWQAYERQALSGLPMLLYRCTLLYNHLATYAETVGWHAVRCWLFARQQAAVNTAAVAASAVMAAAADVTSTEAAAVAAGSPRPGSGFCGRVEASVPAAIGPGSGSLSSSCGIRTLHPGLEGCGTGLPQQGLAQQGLPGPSSGGGWSAELGMLAAEAQAAPAAAAAEKAAAAMEPPQSQSLSPAVSAAAAEPWAPSPGRGRLQVGKKEAPLLEGQQAGGAGTVTVQEDAAGVLLGALPQPGSALRQLGPLEAFGGVRRLSQGPTQAKAPPPPRREEVAAPQRGRVYSRPGAALARWWAVTLRLWGVLLVVLGWRRTPAEDAEAYRLYTANFAEGLMGVMQVMDVVAAATVLSRSGGGDRACVLVAAATGLVMAVAWLVVPWPVWRRMLARAKWPRQLCYTASKFMVAFLGFAQPPATVRHELGGSMFVVEGIILPAAVLMSPAEAVLVGLVRAPLCARMWLLAGAPFGPAAALFRALRVAATGVITTLAIHVYIRLSFERQCLLRAGSRPGALQGLHPPKLKGG